MTRMERVMMVLCLSVGLAVWVLTWHRAHRPEVIDVRDEPVVDTDDGGMP